LAFILFNGGCTLFRAGKVGCKKNKKEDSFLSDESSIFSLKDKESPFLFALFRVSFAVISKIYNRYIAARLNFGRLQTLNLFTLQSAECWEALKHYIKELVFY
jgi:hypothetical protein